MPLPFMVSYLILGSKLFIPWWLGCLLDHQVHIQGVKTVTPQSFGHRKGCLIRRKIRYPLLGDTLFTLQISIPPHKLFQKFGILHLFFLPNALVLALIYWHISLLRCWIHRVQETYRSRWRKYEVGFFEFKSSSFFCSPRKGRSPWRAFTFPGRPMWIYRSNFVVLSMTKNCYFQSLHNPIIPGEITCVTTYEQTCWTLFTP